MADVAPAIDKVGAPEPTAPEAKDVSLSHSAASPSHQDKVGGPKPVEVTSVPETPANGATPASAAHRPELTVVEPAKESPKEPIVMSPATSAGKDDDDDASGAAADKAATGAPNGDSEPAEAAPAAGDKRKLDDGAASHSGPRTGEKEKQGKKAKVGGAIIETNGHAPARKVGRPRKDKNAAPAVGKTARKTRSQGPADV